MCRIAFYRKLREVLFMTTINNSNYDPYYWQRMQGNSSSPTTTVVTSATAPTSSSQSTTPKSISKDLHIPTPVYPDSSVIIPSNGDGTVTIKTPDGREVKFEYPSWEEFFKEEVLADFIKKAQRRQGSCYTDYRNLNIKSFGAPIAFVSMDANNDIVISDDTVKDLCAYIDYLVEEDLLNVDETKEKSQGYNKYLTLLNISEDEAHYMTPKLAKEKLNEFYKNIGNGEKDTNGNYKVPADMYYTYIAENYFDPNYFMNPLESNNLIFMQSATDLGRMYIEYCASKFSYALDKNFTQSQGAYATSSLLYGKIDDGYAAVQGGHFNTRNLQDFPAVVSFLEKDDENGQKLAQMICKAAGVNEDDSDAIKRNKLLNFGKKFLAAKTDSTSSRKFDKMILIAYLNTQGYNDPALYPEKPQMEGATGSFDYSGVSRINDKILTSFNDYEDYEVLYKEVLKLCPQMQEYIKSAINQIGGTYDKKNVQYYLNNFITQAIEAATNPSAKIQGSRPETLKDVFEYVKQLIDEELAQSDAYSMTASNLKELLTGTHKNTLDWRDRELKDFISMLDVPQDKKLPSYFEGYSYAYKPNDAVCEIETYSQYQKLELKELYPQLSDEQIQQILEGKDDYIKEQYAKYKAEGIHSAELFHKLLHDYRNACLADAKAQVGQVTQGSEQSSLDSVQSYTWDEIVEYLDKFEEGSRIDDHRKQQFIATFFDEQNGSFTIKSNISFDNLEIKTLEDIKQILIREDHSITNPESDGRYYGKPEPVVVTDDKIKNCGYNFLPEEIEIYFDKNEKGEYVLKSPVIRENSSNGFSYAFYTFEDFVTFLKGGNTAARTMTNYVKPWGPAHTAGSTNILTPQGKADGVYTKEDFENTNWYHIRELSENKKYASSGWNVMMFTKKTQSGHYVLDKELISKYFSEEDFLNVEGNDINKLAALIIKGIDEGALSVPAPVIETKPPIDEPSGEEPSVTEPPTDEPSVEEPPVTEPEPEIPSWQVPMVNAAKEKGYQATDITGKYTYTDESGTSYVCIWDPIGQNFMNFVTATPQPETEPEFTEDDKTIAPTVDGFYAEAVVAASKEEYEITDDFGVFKKDGKQYEYDIEKEEFIEYNPLESYYSQFDENGFAIKKTLRNIHVESLRRAAELGYSPTNRIGIFEKDGKQYKYDADDHKFVLIKTKEPETKPEEDES